MHKGCSLRGITVHWRSASTLEWLELSIKMLINDAEESRTGQVVKLHAKEFAF